MDFSVKNRSSNFICLASVVEAFSRCNSGSKLNSCQLWEDDFSLIKITFNGITYTPSSYGFFS